MRPADKKNDEYDRRKVLFDKPTVCALYDRYGGEGAIKKHVKTAAKVYEIRSALKYWIDVYEGEPRRISKRIVDQCHAVDSGRPVDVVDHRGEL